MNMRMTFITLIVYQYTFLRVNSDYEVSFEVDVDHKVESVTIEADVSTLKGSIQVCEELGVHEKECIAIIAKKISSLRAEIFMSEKKSPKEYTLRERSGVVEGSQNYDYTKDTSRDFSSETSIVEKNINLFTDCTGSKCQNKGHISEDMNSKYNRSKADFFIAQVAALNNQTLEMDRLLKNASVERQAAALKVAVARDAAFVASQNVKMIANKLLKLKARRNRSLPKIEYDNHHQQFAYPVFLFDIAIAFTVIYMSFVIVFLLSLVMFCSKSIDPYILKLLISTYLVVIVYVGNTYDTNRYCGGYTCESLRNYWVCIVISTSIALLLITNTKQISNGVLTLQ